MKSILNPVNLLILGIMVLTNCTDIPDELRDEASLKDCSSVFNNSTHFCYDGSVYARCNGVRYNPTTHICQGSVANPAKCGGVQYNPLEKGCCGSAAFSLADQRCLGGAVETKCGTDWYDATNQRCLYNEVETRCGSIWYDAANTNLRCQNSIVETKCGTGWYNATNQRCGTNNVVETKCGTDWYNAANTNSYCHYNVLVTYCGNNSYEATNANFRCQDNVVETKCGTTGWYNAVNQRCQSNVVETKCGNEWYDKTNTNLRCDYGVVHYKCGTGSVYHNPATEQCCGNSKYTTATEQCCGNSKYTTATEFCQGGTTIKSLCNGQEFLATHYCKNNLTPTKYGSVLDGDGTSYKTVEIGSQIWMAENLNYAVSGSKCLNGSEYLLSDNNTTACNIYGRWYDWATAMGLEASCNTSTCSDQIDPEKDICPSGWHIPNSSDWDVLMRHVQTDNVSTYASMDKLKATNGWTDLNGLYAYFHEDNYGFAALPGGTGIPSSLGDRWSDSFGINASWHVANESTSTFSMVMSIDYDMHVGNSYKSFLRNLRCVQD